MAVQPQIDATLQEQIDAFRAERASKGPTNPEATAAREKMLEQLVQSEAVKVSLQMGAQAPDFLLPNVDGTIVSLSTLLQSGPVVITFYRGDWCPFCNFTLRAYERILPQIQAAGAVLVAISPQIPDYSILTAQSRELTYPVLSDVGNAVARRYGLVFIVPEAVRPYSANLLQYNGDESWELPMTGTFVVGHSGEVTLASVNPSYMLRLEPAAILAELDRLQAVH